MYVLYIYICIPICRMARPHPSMNSPFLYAPQSWSSSGFPTASHCSHSQPSSAAKRCAMFPEIEMLMDDTKPWLV